MLFVLVVVSSAFLKVHGAPLTEDKAPVTHLEGNSPSENLLKVLISPDHKENPPIPPQNTRHYVFPWDKITKFLNAVPNVNRPAPSQLQPLKYGPGNFWEQSELFQKSARLCVDAEVDPFSWTGILCSGIIDVGISLIIAVKNLQDSAICLISNELADDELPCLLWLVFRHFLSVLIPDDLQHDFPYLRKRLLA